MTNLNIGDIVKYKEVISPNQYKGSWIWHQGLIVNFNKAQNMYEILDHKTGKIILKHESDLQIIQRGFS